MKPNTMPHLGCCDVCGQNVMLIHQDRPTLMKVGKCCKKEMQIAHVALDDAKKFGIDHPIP